MFRWARQRAFLSRLLGIGLVAMLTAGCSLLPSRRHCNCAPACDDCDGIPLETSMSPTHEGHFVGPLPQLHVEGGVHHGPSFGAATDIHSEAPCLSPAPIVHAPPQVTSPAITSDPLSAPTIHPTPPPRQQDTNPAREPATDDRGVPPRNTTELNTPPRVEVPKERPAPSIDTPKVIAKTPEAAPKPVDNQPKTVPPDLTKSAPVIPTQTSKTAPRPAALRAKATASRVVTQVGDDVTFEIIVENQGGSPLARLDFEATFSDNLKVKSLSPERAGKIEGNKIVFNRIENLMPSELKFQIVAQVSRADAGTGRMSLEVRSPILGESPLKDNAVIRILQ